ncbi:MAG: N-acetylmuramoyl-L-alanine amidase [Prolixibacteraceae bacterium]|nr:N-acetylmuramoyl-L-alanine amidase [Prolixibacteraceae bacterium]
MGSKIITFGIKWIWLFIIFSFVFYGADGQQKNGSIKTVVIDAGHGGKDPGTVVGKAKEKNIVLDIALKLGNLIRQNQQNIKVVYIRDGDYFVPLLDRAQIANKANADLFISIHANYCGSPEIHGTETYVLGLHRTEDNLNVAKKENSVILLEEDYSTRYEGFNPNLSESYIMFELVQDAYLDQSLRFASILQSNFKEVAQRNNRDVRQAGFLVLRETAMPSVLIETGYLSNKKENSFLQTDNGRNEIAHSIYGSLINYLEKLDTKEIIPDRQTNGINPENTQKPKHKSTPERNQTELEPSRSGKNSIVADTSTKTLQKVKSGTLSEKKRPEKMVTESGITYAIQIGVFSRKISLDSKSFKGITPIKEMIFNGNYKYYCFESDSFQTTKSNYEEVSKKFPDAFIVSIQNNKTKMVWMKEKKK